MTASGGMLNLSSWRRGWWRHPLGTLTVIVMMMMMMILDEIEEVRGQRGSSPRSRSGSCSTCTFVWIGSRLLSVVPVIPGRKFYGWHVINNYWSDYCFQYGPAWRGDARSGRKLQKWASGEHFESLAIISY